MIRTRLLLQAARRGPGTIPAGIRAAAEPRNDAHEEAELLARLQGRPPRGARVAAVRHGVAEVRGLRDAATGSLVALGDDGAQGLALVMNIEKGDRVRVALLSDPPPRRGARVAATGARPAFPADAPGRVLSPLGAPLDGGAPVAGEPLPPPPGLTALRASLRPMTTGLRGTDLLSPLAFGVAREAASLDEALGALRHHPELALVYVLVGASHRRAVAAINRVRAVTDAATVIVAADADPPALRYLAPLAGCAAAEAVRARGGDALLVVDDLAAHAAAYDDLADALQRPPLPEHAGTGLLQRAGALVDRGSLTALAIPGAGGGPGSPEPEQQQLHASVATDGRRFQPPLLRRLGDRLQRLVHDARREREVMDVVDQLGLLVEGEAEIDFARGSYADRVHALLAAGPDPDAEDADPAASNARNVVAVHAALGGFLNAAAAADQVPELERAVWAAARDAPGLVAAVDAALRERAVLPPAVHDQLVGVIRSAATEFSDEENPLFEPV